MTVFAMLYLACRKQTLQRKLKTIFFLNFIQKRLVKFDIVANIVFCFVLFCFVLLCFALLCFALLCFALLCFALLCFALLCFALFLFFTFFKEYTIEENN